MKVLCKRGIEKSADMLTTYMQINVNELNTTPRKHMYFQSVVVISQAAKEKENTV
jgi:hypothetical protein